MVKQYQSIFESHPSVFNMKKNMDYRGDCQYHEIKRYEYYKVLTDAIIELLGLKANQLYIKESNTLPEGVRGEYKKGTSTILINKKWVMDTNTKLSDIIQTITHEATHRKQDLVGYNNEEGWYHGMDDKCSALLYRDMSLDCLEQSLKYMMSPGEQWARIEGAAVKNAFEQIEKEGNNKK